MPFSSILFTFLFLPVFLIVYHSVPSLRGKNLVLLGGSLLFFLWAGPVTLCLLLIETVIAWKGGQIIDRTIDQRKRNRKTVLPVLLCLILFIVFKYFGAFRGLLVPIGISIYSLELISYLLDVNKKTIKAEQAFFYVLLYASMFLVAPAGPLVRYEQIAAELHNRETRLTDLAEGARRFTIGLAKKAVLADTCARVAEELLPAAKEALTQISAVGIWLGIVFYGVMIFLYFSSYADMALGLGRMLGLTLEENFDHPYAARSLTEWWYSWNISLGDFFQDYVYTPINRRTGGRIAVLIMLLTWALIGLWYGPKFNFLLWGIYIGIFMVLEAHGFAGRLRKTGSHIYTLLVLGFGWILFRFDSAGSIFTCLRCMFGLAGNGIFSRKAIDLAGANLIILAIGILISTSRMSSLGEKIRTRMSDSDLGVRILGIWEIAYPVLLLILSWIYMMRDQSLSLLYFRL